ncbi:MAG: hypothetical protein AB1743_05025 [Actinomycetota bacterium]
MKKYYHSWEDSSHSSVACRNCHERSPSEGLFSIKRTALSRLLLHFVKKEKKPKAYVSNERCLQCHSSIKKRIYALKNSSVVNPHPVHLEAGFACAHCHRRVVHVFELSLPNKPQMKVCIHCHKAKNISNKCKTCHYRTQQHVDQIAQAGGYRLKKGEKCDVCHTRKDSDKTDHEEAIRRIGGYDGPRTCTKCHVYAIKQIEESVHSKLKTGVAHVRGLKKKKGMANKAANPALWAYLVKKKDGTIKSGGCGKCHVGGNNVPTPEMASAIDCLICHSRKYDIKKRRVVLKDGFMKWVGDESSEAISSIGIPKPEYCLRCHDDHMGYNRGTPYTPEADVHAKAGMPCQSCHVTIEHKVAKGNVADLMANDIPELAISCTSCHVSYKHGVKKIDVHLKRLACQTCHIGRIGGLAIRDKTRGVDKDNDGIFEEYKAENPNMNASFFWFNGMADQGGNPEGVRNDKKAKIYPFKAIKLREAVDLATKQSIDGRTKVFAETGDFNLSLNEMAKILKLPQPPRWKPVDVLKLKQVSHTIRRKGLSCNDCHSRKGIMDFKALGYTGRKLEELRKPQNY